MCCVYKWSRGTADKGIQDKNRLGSISCYWNFPKQKPIFSLPATYHTICQPSEMQILAIYAGITS